MRAATRFLARALAVIALLAATATTSQAITTYGVDRPVGTGRITGTIVTNGKTGVLTVADVVDWNLQVDGDGDPSTVGVMQGPLSGANSNLAFVEGGALTATPEGLFFDFGASSGFTVLQFTTPDSRVAWQLQGDTFQDEMARETLEATMFVTHGPVTQQIATNQGSTFSLALGLTHVRVREEAEDGLRIRGSFTIDSCGDGFDPSTEPVSLTVSNALGIVYPTSPSVFPIQPGEFELLVAPAGRRWRLTEAGRLRTGIERFEIDDRDGSIVFVDRELTLPQQPYSQVKLELTVGNDSGRAEAALIEFPCDSGRWRVGR